MTVSIIIVHYQVQKELLACLHSLFHNKATVSFEVIVVDNDQSSSLQNLLRKQFPQVQYIKSNKNLGYSGGNNLGATYAKGKYLFFLNPDTIVKKGTIERLASFLDKKKEVGVVAPVLLDANEQVYKLQGTKELTPIRALFSLSFIQKVFPNNPIANSYWNKDWDKKNEKKVDVVPGSACMIRKTLFEKLGGFDENYFLYFEEHDLSNRVRNAGYTLFMLPQAQVVHFWGESTKKSKEDIKKIFLQSRFYYFKKFYGFPKALITEAILRISKQTFLLAGILVLAAFLRFYELHNLMMFIGDFGWFYLSARDMLISSEIPLVGIASSHPWIHQGAFWTYLLAMALWIGNFHPLAGGYLAAAIGVLTVFVMYYCTKQLYNNTTALFTAAFFAASPLVSIHARMPYHTTPIPLFVMLYIYSVYRWVKGNVLYFPLSLFLLIVLYNFELATAVFAPLIFLPLMYGIYKKTIWAKKLWNRKIILLSFVGVLIPLLPMLVYDFSHGFPQTLKFIAWLGYRGLVLFGYPRMHGIEDSPSYADMMVFLNQYTQLFVYSTNGWIALSLVVVSIGIFLSLLYTKRTTSYTLIALSFFIPLLALLVSKTPSEAYLPMLFPPTAILIGIAFAQLCTREKQYKWALIFLFVLMIASNVFSLIQHNFFVGNRELYGYTFFERVAVAKQIITAANGKEYTIIRSNETIPRGFTLQYEYLTWWLGHGMSENSKQKIRIHEDNERITVTPL